MALSFRNLTVTPDDPVEEWGVEGILAAIERGGLADWVKIIAAVVAVPSGPVAADLEEAIAIAESAGSVAAIRHAIAHRTASPREVAQRRLRQAVYSTEYTQAEAAERLGTSSSRLSTYLNGQVMPSAEFLIRAEALAAKRVAEVG